MRDPGVELTPSVRVLVAEDDGEMRELLCRVLGEEGYDVIAVGDGHQALARIDEGQFDLVLSDVRMPGPDAISQTFPRRAGCISGDPHDAFSSTTAGSPSRRIAQRQQALQGRSMAVALKFAALAAQPIPRSPVDGIILVGGEQFHWCRRPWRACWLWFTR